PVEPSNPTNQSSLSTAESLDNGEENPIGSLVPSAISNKTTADWYKAGTALVASYQMPGKDSAWPSNNGCKFSAEDKLIISDLKKSFNACRTALRLMSKFGYHDTQSLLIWG